MKRTLDEILGAKQHGVDCDSDESARIKGYFDKHDPLTGNDTLAKGLADQFPLECDEWQEEVERGLRHPTPDSGKRTHFFRPEVMVEEDGHISIDWTNCGDSPMTVDTETGYEVDDLPGYERALRQLTAWIVETYDGGFTPVLKVGSLDGGPFGVTWGTDDDSIAQTGYVFRSFEEAKAAAIAGPLETKKRHQVDAMCAVPFDPEPEVLYGLVQTEEDTVLVVPVGAQPCSYCEQRGHPVNQDRIGQLTCERCWDAKIDGPWNVAPHHYDDSPR